MQKQKRKEVIVLVM